MPSSIITSVRFSGVSGRCNSTSSRRTASSVAGTTGPRAGLSDELPGLVRRARRLTGVPLLAGFGIATPGHAAEAAALTDGVVVGSRAIEVADAEGPKGLRAFVASLREALAAAPALAGDTPRG